MSAPRHRWRFTLAQQEERERERQSERLPLGEQASWAVQRVIRNWAFLGVFTAFTLWVWVFLDPIWRHPITDQWNLWASYMAIFIEGVTAMALINQTRRDALVIREIRAIVREELWLAQRTLRDVEASSPAEEDSEDSEDS